MSRFFGRRFIVAVVVLIILAFAAKPGLNYYRFMTTHVTTDDAYVDGTVDLISSRVTGTVSQVYVQDNWIVKAGDLLISLDPADSAVRVERARANLNRARSMVDQEYAQLTESEAGQRLAEAQLSQAQTDYKRARTLRTVGVVSQEFYDQSETAFRASEANLALAKQEVARSRAALGGADNVDHERYDQAIVKQAESELKTVELDLGYTNIRAPVSGVITRKSVHIGHRVQAGEPLMTIVPLDSLYVTANFKETQLTYVRVGQKAEIIADIYPDFAFKGHVDSISLGTGAAFSLLPPENATGNWVKVVQRVPVKIVFDQTIPPNRQLRLGLSVDASIDVSNTRGPLISSLMQREFRRFHSQGATPR
ncbi:MAG TPA: HlyD family secretion protein [Candidatus Binataceae bacterium]|jgi:membrane fusion protein (multidrug efflux system)